MTDSAPVDVTNLDRYGSPPLEWTRVHDQLAAGPPDIATPFFLGTVTPEGRPHAVGIGAVWHDGDLYFTSGPGARKTANLAANPACTMSTRLTGIDVVFEGDAAKVTDKSTLDTLVAVYRESGWPAEVEGDAFTAPFSAPSAGPPPWHLYRLTYRTVFGVATAEPQGATRWRF